MPPNCSPLSPCSILVRSSNLDGKKYSLSSNISLRACVVDEKIAGLLRKRELKH